MTLVEQIKQGEDKKLELKETLPKNENIAKTVIAFSNTAGGKLVIGVADNHDFIGVDDSQIFNMQDKIASIIADSCSPTIIPEIYNINIKGKLILVVEVVRGNLKPYFLKKHGKADGTYIRIGATNRVADLEIIADLERQKQNLSFDEEVCYDEEFKDLDISPLVKNFEQQGKSLDDDKLKNLKLIKLERNKLYPTNALMILLGKFWHCTVKCARFKGTTMSVFTDKKEYSGDIFSILENTQSFILNHINLRAEIKELYRTDTYEIPISAIREALVNAIIHRDYINKGRDVKVGIYDDIVNIVSPGGLPNTITIEDAFNGRSEAKNRVIANVFKELGLIEQWGTGLNRIINECKEHGLQPPKIEEKNDFFDVEIMRPRPITADNDQLTDGKPADTGEKPADTGKKTADTGGELVENRRIPADCKEQEAEVFKYLFKNESIRSKKVEELFSVKDSRARELLNTLVEKGYVEKHGKARSTFYTLAERGCGDE